VEAVVDKDRAASVLARSLGARRMMILTAVRAIYSGFGTAEERVIDRLTLEEARALHVAGEFDAGSMGPKVESAVAFLDAGGEEVMVASLDEAAAALGGRSGTRIVRAVGAGLTPRG
jgi:carbamate kinase